MKKVKLISVLVAVILGLILILQNTQPVAIRILFLKITMPKVNGRTGKGGRTGTGNSWSISVRQPNGIRKRRR